MSYIILPTKADNINTCTYTQTSLYIGHADRLIINIHCRLNKNSMRLAAAVRHTKCERETEGKKLQGRNNYETLWTNHSTKMISEPNESEPNCGVASLTCCLA